MTKNTLLNIGIIICNILLLFQILSFVILTGIFVHVQISPSTYKVINLNDKTTTSGIGFIGFSQTTSNKIHINGKVPEDSDVFTIDNLKTSSLYINFVQMSIGLILSILCLYEFLNVIKSVKKINTFQNRNITSFRRIGMYLLIIFILSSYVSFSFLHGGFSRLQITFVLPILASLAFIMAEIFKEGNKLLEENKLTV